MIAQEIIATIREEIERRIHETNNDITVGVIESGIIGKTLRQFLSFLSDLEESEKPMNQDEELNEEIKKEMAKLPFFLRGKDQIAFARHFAEWGAEHLKQ